MSVIESNTGLKSDTFVKHRIQCKLLDISMVTTQVNKSLSIHGPHLVEQDCASVFFLIICYVYSLSLVNCK